MATQAFSRRAAVLLTGAAVPTCRAHALPAMPPATVLHQQSAVFGSSRQLVSLRLQRERMRRCLHAELQAQRMIDVDLSIVYRGVQWRQAVWWYILVAMRHTIRSKR